YIAADITDFGELGSLNFKEWRVGHSSESTGDLGLTHASCSNHDDVLWHYIDGHVRWQLLPSYPIAQGDRNRPFRVSLANHMLVELGDNLPRSHLVQANFFINIA